MPTQQTSIVRFDGALNAVSTPNALRENEVQLSTNIDFSLEWQGMACRRGYVVYGTAGINSLYQLGRNYNGTSSSLDASPWYGVIGGGGGFVRGTLSSTTITFSSIGAGGTGLTPPSMTAYQNYAYLAQGGSAIRDNGTAAYNWVLDQPNAPYVTIGPGYGVFTPFDGTYTAVTGTVVAVGGSPILNTCTTGTTTGTGTVTNTVIEITGAVTGTHVWTNGTTTWTNSNSNWDNPLYFAFNTATAVSTYTIGNFGVDYILLGFSDPGAVVSISRDASIGDATFTNYWHAETTIGDLQSASPDPTGLFLQFQADQSYEDQIAARQKLFHNPAVKAGQAGPREPLSTVQPLWGSVMNWAVPRSNYQLIGAVNNPGWSSIQAVRIVVQTLRPLTMYVGGWTTYGSSLVCLSDTVNGYSWYQTFARVEDGVVVAESCPSNPSFWGTATDQPAPLTCQYGAALLSLGLYTGTATSGITHRILYRTGGLLNDAYKVDMIPVTSTVFDDEGYPDTYILSNGTMTRSLWTSWPSGGVNAISEPFQNRIFIGTNNSLFWTALGAPTSIQSETETDVSIDGDPIQAFVVWDRLIIINNNSVYEMDGSVWEGPNADWSLRRTGCRRGSAAPATAIKTPYGILLLGYDGLSLYTPGYGVDTQLDWVTEKVGDLWKGTATNNPAAQKGRCPALNLSAISSSCACFADGKIYLAIPTAASSTPNMILVIDMAHNDVWFYDYSSSITLTSLFYDYVGGRLMGGTAIGTVVRLETGQTDGGSAIRWSVRTRAWSTNVDMVLENLGVEVVGGSSQVVANAILDNTSTVALGTFTNITKQWYNKSALGTVCNNFVVDFEGTQTGSTIQQTVYQLKWDALVQPPKVTYWRTDFDDGGHKAEKIWDVHFSEIDVQGTGTVTCVDFVDNVAVNTSTIVGPTNGPTLNPDAYPNETYGNIGYSTYTAGVGVTFKLYDAYNATRPEPPRVTNYVSDRFQPHTLASWKAEIEGWWHEAIFELNCLGATVLATVVLDGSALGTYTCTGSGRKGYSFALPSESYGNVIHTVFNVSGGVMKHYTTYYNFNAEPSRGLFAESTITAPPSENVVKTWLADINCLGGTVLGTVFADSIAVMTATFTGSNRVVQEVGLPNITNAKTLKATYNSSTVFKHWKTDWEMEAKPFTKTDWLVTYKKLGGFTQLDMLRYHSFDVEIPPTSTFTSTWVGDGVVVLTDTFTNTGTSSRYYIDQIPFPPGVRGYIFEQLVSSVTPFKIWKSSLDMEKVGVKGFSRLTLHGTPIQSSAISSEAQDTTQ